MKRNEYHKRSGHGLGVYRFYKDRWHHELYLERNGRITSIGDPRPDVKWFNFFAFVLNSYGIKSSNPIILGDE